MKTLSTVLAASAIALAAGSAHAALSFDGDESFNGGVELLASSATPLFQEVTFSNFFGGSTPFYSFLDFTTTRQTTVTFEDYQPTTNTTGQISAFIIEELAGPGGSRTGNFITNATGFACANGIGGSAAADGIANSQCQQINGTNGNAGFPPPIAFTFGPGSYRLGFIESGNPSQVQGDFTISAVPLPFAGLLMLTAVGGAAAAYRKRKSA